MVANALILCRVMFYSFMKKSCFRFLVAKVRACNASTPESNIAPEISCDVANDSPSRDLDFVLRASLVIPLRRRSYRAFSARREHF